MKNTLQHTKSGLDLAPHSPKKAALGFRPRLSLATIRARWREHLHPMLLMQYRLKCRAMEGAITQDQQIVRLLEERTHGRRVVQRGWCQQPVINYLADRK